MRRTDSTGRLVGAIATYSLHCGPTGHNRTGNIRQGADAKSAIRSPRASLHTTVHTYLPNAQTRKHRSALDNLVRPTTP